MCVSDGIFALLGCYAALIGGYLSTFRVWPLKMELIGFPEASITNYQSTLLRVPAERRPQQRVYCTNCLETARNWKRKWEMEEKTERKKCSNLSLSRNSFQYKSYGTLMAFSWRQYVTQTKFRKIYIFPSVGFWRWFISLGTVWFLRPITLYSRKKYITICIMNKHVHTWFTVYYTFQYERVLIKSFVRPGRK